MPAHLSSDSRSPRSQREARTAALVRRLGLARSPEEAARIRTELVLTNLGVAESVANRYRDRGVPGEDLDQVAYEGLVRAVSRFDPTLESDLLAFAVPTIRGTLQRHFRDHSWAVRPPRRVQELQAEIRRAAQELAQEHGRDPSAAEIQALLGVGHAEYLEAAAAFGCFRPASLDQSPDPGRPQTRGELLEQDPHAERAMEARLVLEPVLEGLSPRDRRIVHLRFVEERTQSEIGEILGVSQMQVSRLLTRILGELRARVTTDGATADLAS